MTTIAKRIAHLNPCQEAVAWLGRRTSVRRAWAECTDPEWMLWVCERLGIDTSATIYWCAEHARQSAIRALDSVGVKHELAALAAIVSQDTARAAARAAEPARAAARAAWAAEAAAWARDAAWAAARAAEAAARAARAAAWAAEAAARDAGDAARAAGDAARAEICTHVRAVIPWETVDRAIEERHLRGQS